MVKYEMGVVVRADLPDDGFTVEMDRVKALIDRFGGTIDKIDEWGRRRLAYPIAKQTEGIYTFITYTAEPSAPKEIESRVRLLENVLRFLTVRKDEVEATVVPAAAEPAPIVPEPVIPESAPVAVEAEAVPVEEPVVEAEPAAEAETPEAETVEAEVPEAEAPVVTEE